MLNLKTMEIEIKGTAPLLMHNRRLANPMDAMAVALREVSAKRKKTDADHAAMARIEFAGAIYADDRGPFIPTEWIESAIRDGAKTFKQGKATSAAVWCTSADGFPLIYKGPKTTAALFENSSFVDSRGVKIGKARVQRTRPIFNAWAVKFDITVNEDVMSAKDVERACENAGVLVGLGDYRPKYGRFQVVSVKVAK